MMYEVDSVEPVVNERTVLLVVRHWHRDQDHGNKEADFVEHHLIEFPAATLIPVRNEVGQYVRADGIFEFAWRLNANDEWERWEPEMGDPDYQWIVQEADRTAMVTDALSTRAKDLAKQKRKGDGLLKKKPASYLGLSMASSAKVREFVGKPKKA